MTRWKIGCPNICDCAKGDRLVRTVGLRTCRVEVGAGSSGAPLLVGFACHRCLVVVQAIVRGTRWVREMHSGRKKKNACQTRTKYSTVATEEHVENMAQGFEEELGMYIAPVLGRS